MTLQRKSFAEVLTFSRAGEATFFGSNGLLQTAAAGVPRFEYDPVTLAPKGILIEGTRTNLVTRSSDLSHVDWGKTSATVTPSSGVDPTGAVGACLVSEDVGSSEHGILAPNVNYVSGQMATFSVAVKSSGRTRFRLLLPSAAFTENKVAIFDTTTMEVVSTIGAGVTARILSYPSGYVRITITATATTTVSTTAGQLRFISGVSDVTYIGDGVSGAYVWGAQSEAGAFPSSYIPTTTVAVTRAADNLYMTPEQFAPWYRQDAGSIGVLFRPNTNGVGPTGSPSYPRVWEIDGTGAPSDGIMLTATSDGGQRVRSEVVNGSSSQVSIDQSTTLGTGALTRHGFGVKANDFAVTLGGAAVVADATGTIPTPNRLTLGSANAGAADHLFGHIAEFLYFPQRLANADLQQVCA